MSCTTLTLQQAILRNVMNTPKEMGICAHRSAVGCLAATGLLTSEHLGLLEKALEMVALAGAEGGEDARLIRQLMQDVERLAPASQPQLATAAA